MLVLQQGTRWETLRAASPLCLLVCGLRGCGKTSLCEMLCAVLDGTLVAERGGRACWKPSDGAAKSGFVDAVRDALVRRLALRAVTQARPVIVDSESLSKAERLKILDETAKLGFRERGGKTVLVDFRHDTDSYHYESDGQALRECSHEHIALCAGRVRQRGDADAALDLHAEVARSAVAAQWPCAQECARFDLRILVDVARPPPDVAFDVISELEAKELLGDLRCRGSGPGGPGPWLLDLRLQAAWRAQQRRAERSREQLRGSARLCASPLAGPPGGRGFPFSSEQMQPNWMTHSLDALRFEEDASELAKNSAGGERAAGQGSAQKPWYWKIALPQLYTLVSSLELLPANFAPVREPHVTLLYLGGDVSEREAAKRQLLSVEELRRAIARLEAVRGQAVEVRLLEAVLDENVVVLAVSLPSSVPCYSRVAHVTLGMLPGVPAASSADLLLELGEGRHEGKLRVPILDGRTFRGNIEPHFVEPRPVSAGRGLEEGAQGHRLDE